MKEQKVICTYVNNQQLSEPFKSEIAAGWQIVSINVESNHIARQSYGTTGIYIVALLERMIIKNV